MVKNLFYNFKFTFGFNENLILNIGLNILRTDMETRNDGSFASNRISNIYANVQHSANILCEARLTENLHTNDVVTVS